jgi:hypothetical protein
MPQISLGEKPVRLHFQETEPAASGRGGGSVGDISLDDAVEPTGDECKTYTPSTPIKGNPVWFADFYDDRSGKKCDFSIEGKEYHGRGEQCTSLEAFQKGIETLMAGYDEKICKAYKAFHARTQGATKGTCVARFFTSDGDQPVVAMYGSGAACKLLRAAEALVRKKMAAALPEYKKFAGLIRKQFER